MAVSRFICSHSRLLSRKCVIRIIQCSATIYFVKMLIDINMAVRFSPSAGYTAKKRQQSRVVSGSTKPQPTGRYLKDRETTGKSSLQIVSLKNIKREGEHWTHNIKIPPKKILNESREPWDFLQGMALSSNLSMPENQNIYYKRQQYSVNQFDYPFSILPHDLCSNKTYLVALIHSRADYFESRRALRETWVGAARRGYWPGHGRLPAEVKVVFMLAFHGNATVKERVRKESREQNDIVLCGFKDSYFNMTIKSMMGLRFVAEECQQAKYLLKMDDDVIVNLPYLLGILQKGPKQGLVLGPINPSSKVGRGGGKWAVPKRIYPFARYPPYLSGAAYVISADLAPRMVALAPYVPAFHVDDVYVTGVLTKVMKITPRGKTGFAYWGSPIPNVCALVKNRIITATKVKGQLRRELWNKLDDASERKKCFK